MASGPLKNSPLDTFILSHFKQTERHQTLADLVRICAARQHCNQRAVRGAIGRLVAAGELQYAQRFGCTFVEIAWSRLQRVSPRIFLCPENINPSTVSIGPDAVVVRLAQGSAFGVGDHATTRLALAGIDEILSKAMPAEVMVLDIGTGTGVLAIAALALGGKAAVALDTDPCALWETRHNAETNCFAERIRILGDPVESIAGTFDLIAANLRLPTLLCLAGTVGRLLNPAGAAVFSGFRPEEKPDLISTYGTIGMKVCWYSQCQGWAGIGFSPSGKRD